MFDQFKAMGAIAGLLKDKDRVREAGERVKRRLDDARVLGEAGAGAVRVTASGSAKVLSVELAPAIISGLGAGEQSRTMAESLIAEAVNHALEQAQLVMRKEAAEAARELGIEGIPGLENMLATR